MKTIIAFVAVILLAACTTPKPLKPGAGSVSAPGGATATFSQPENPAQAAAQDFSSETTTELPLSAGDIVTEHVTTTNKTTGVPVTTTKSVTVSKPTVMKTTTKVEVRSKIGAAQKDVARELGAKLAAARPVQWAGFILIVAALAMFHPAVKAVTMSRSLQGITFVAGLVLIFAPMVIAGNEALILFGCFGAALVWFIAHNHGHLKGLVDADRDGIDDRVEELVEQMKTAKNEEEIAALIKKGVKYPGGTAALEAAAELRRKELAG